MVDLELLRAAPLIDVVWFSIEFQEVQLGPSYSVSVHSGVCTAPDDENLPRVTLIRLGCTSFLVRDSHHHSDGMERFTCDVRISCKEYQKPVVKRHREHGWSARMYEGLQVRFRIASNGSAPRG